jgi:hypothetical protein
LEHLLGAHVERLVLRRLDMVNDSTVVEVRYRLDAQRASMTTVDSLAVLEGSPA